MTKKKYQRQFEKMLPTAFSRQEALRWAVLLFVVVQLIAACSSAPDPHDSNVDLTIMSLNLHTYQELRAAGTTESELTDELARKRIEAYGLIFDRIAAGINELDPDIICFQEVGEWSGGVQDDLESLEFGSTDTNMVHQILSRLGDRQYYYTMDWSHYGWEVWMEGSAILSKYPLSFTESRFISNPDHGRHDFWKSRNVPAAKVDLPRVGEATIFSVHTGWWNDPDEPFQEQYRRLLRWAAEVADPPSTTVLCGDFNIPAGSPMYHSMMEGTGYLDQYVLANPAGMLDATIGGGADGWEKSVTGQRIDYILMNDDSPLDVTQARRVFTGKYLGRVSDHVGIYAEFTIRKAR